MKFVMVGVINTIVGTTIMFVFYNVFHLSYWVSSASNYFFGSICSYFLNKHFTFQYHERGWASLFRFTINIVCCYLLAYGIAKPLMQWILTDFSKTIQENVSMLLGMCLSLCSTIWASDSLPLSPNNYCRPKHKRIIFT